VEIFAQAFGVLGDDGDCENAYGSLQAFLQGLAITEISASNGFSGSPSQVFLDCPTINDD
jgi:hypothetical protein